MLELVVLLGQTIVIVAALYLIKKTLERRLDELTTEAMGFYQNEKQEIFGYYAKEKKDIIENMPVLINLVADGLFAKFKGMVAGQASGLARLDKGLAEAITTDAISGQNPLLGMILERFPTAKKYVSKNPAAIGQLANIAQQFMGPQQGQGLRGGRVPDRLRSMRY